MAKHRQPVERPPRGAERQRVRRRSEHEGAAPDRGAVAAADPAAAAATTPAAGRGASTRWAGRGRLGQQL
jgi:hypothetical protein